MAIRDRIRKAAEVFVEFQPDGDKGELPNRLPGTDPARDIASFSAAQGQRMPRSKVESAHSTFPQCLDVNVDIASIYKRAQLPQARVTAEQVIKILASIPADLPPSAKQQSGIAMIKTMAEALGITPESVIEDARLKLRAISDYLGEVSQDSSRVVNGANNDIADMRSRIEEAEAAIQNVQRIESEIENRFAKETDQLRRVVAFFDDNRSDL